MHSATVVATLALSFSIAACSSAAVVTPSSGGDAGLDPSQCLGQPKSQPASAPCCLGYGVDACGANLFCAAFDGRTQPTCYIEHSRMAGEACTGDVQCATTACNTGVGKCKALPGTTCDAAIGCASDPKGEAYACDPAKNQCIAKGYGLLGEYCASPSDCQPGVGLTCSSGHCAPAAPVMDPYQCFSMSRGYADYGQCRPTMSGSFTFTKACTERLDPNTNQRSPGVACPEGFSCDTYGGSFTSFGFCD